MEKKEILKFFPSVLILSLTMFFIFIWNFYVRNDVACLNVLLFSYKKKKKKKYNEIDIFEKQKKYDVQVFDVNCF